MASIPTGNDPFSGGSITRTGQANVAGGIPSADTGVGNPIGGVNPGAIFSARNNQGSNIGIPYTRLCPLGQGRDAGGGLGRPPTKEDQADLSQPASVTESEDLRSMTLAFILGKRSAPGVGDAPVFGANESVYTSDVFGLSFNTNGIMAPGMPGTERFQKLCSLEYLSRYFTNVLWSKGILLRGTRDDRPGGLFYDELAPGGGGGPLQRWKTGLPRMFLAASDKRTKDRNNAQPDAAAAGVDIRAMLNAASLTNVGDLGTAMGLPGSPASMEPAIRQGIFARDFGPFLRGKGITHEMLAGTASASVQGIPGVAKAVAPYHTSRCAGDELAFALFERLLEEKGFSDWRPDGIVLSKGADDPSDKLSDELLKSRDGELFNIRVQGPAVTSTWTGDPALEVMPLDKVFVVIVADVWWGDLARADADVRAFVDGIVPSDGATGAPPGGDADAKKAALRAYLRGREEELRCGTGGRGITKGSLSMPIDAATRRVFAARPGLYADLVGFGTDPGDPGVAPYEPPAGPPPALPGPDPGSGDGSPGALSARAQWQLANGAYPGLRTNWEARRNAVAAAAALLPAWQVRADDKQMWDDALRDAQRAYDDAEPFYTFSQAQLLAYADGSESTRLCNFRVMLATSSQMVNYSAPRFGGSGHQVCSPDTDGNEFRRVHNQSRMGLRLGCDGGEYIVGGWCIGNVLDTAASRAAFPSAGTNIGVRTAPNSMAINLNVKVEWWDADRMWRSFMNVDESLTPRYVETKPLIGVNVAANGTKTPNGKYLYRRENMPPKSASAIRKELDENGTAARVYDARQGNGAGDYAALPDVGKDAVLADLVPSLALA